MSNSETRQYAQVIEDNIPCEDNDCRCNPSAHPKNEHQSVKDCK